MRRRRYPRGVILPLRNSLINCTFWDIRGFNFRFPDSIRNPKPADTPPGHPFGNGSNAIGWS